MNAILLFGIFVLVGCAPVKSPSRLAKDSNDLKTSDTGAGNGSGGVTSASVSDANKADGVSNVDLKGRQVDLYAIRAGNAKVFLPPEFDKLPCSYFRQGPEFEIPPIPGGPPLSIRGPVQNFYSGNWVRESEYSFKLSVYKRIYRDPGIPDWLSSPPTTRTQEYVLKLFDAVVSAPTSEGCRISARPLN